MNLAMEILSCTLLADGSSDRVLQPILTWLLDAHSPRPHSIEYAPIFGGTLERRIARALDAYPCDLLFVHRDAETATLDDRVAEVQGAWSANTPGVKTIAVVPVRMTEAWLLFSEDLIRQASGNPNGTVPLNLPRLARIEQLPDPKDVLFDALKIASGLSPSRLRRFRPDEHRHRIAEVATDFAPLRALPAFRHLEAQVQAVFQN